MMIDEFDDLEGQEIYTDSDLLSDSYAIYDEMPEDSAQKFNKEIDDAKALMIHETYNLYASQGILLPYPAPTWWLLSDNGVKNIVTIAADSLDHMFEELKTYPAMIKGAEIIYQAKYEMRAFQKGWRSPEGIISKKNANNVIGWIDFLSGIPYGAIEMLTLVAEVGTEPKDCPVDPGYKATPPVPKKFFNKRYKRKRILFNYIWKAEDNVKALAKPVPVGDKAKKLWWLRINLTEDEIYPFPGEFVALGVRIFPNLPWGAQRSNPYLISGAWIDTVYYTSGIVKNVIHDEEYDKYLIQWKGQTIIAKPTDFAPYKVNDRVTIIKNINASKPTQRCDDEDADNFDDEEWAIAPITFYGEGLE
jgi:hypothetical protein